MTTSKTTRRARMLRTRKHNARVQRAHRRHAAKARYLRERAQLRVVALVDDE